MKKFIKAIKNEIFIFFSEFKDNFRNIKTKKDLVKQIPNFISITRPIIFLPLILPLIINKQLIVAGIITAIAALSDSLDGTLARRLKATSIFGAKLDVVCDKLFALIIGCFLISTTMLTLIPITFEVLISMMTIHFKTLGTKMKVSKLGKIKTVFLDFLLCSLFFRQYSTIYLISNGLFLITSLLQIITIINYYNTFNKKIINNDIYLTSKKELNN